MHNAAKLFIHITFLTGLFFLAAISADAQTIFTVNSTADDQSDGCGTSIGTCTLREAITAANTSLSTADTINFDQSVFGSGATINLIWGEFTITDGVTIQQTSAVAPVTLDASGNSRIFNVNAGVSVTLTRLKLTNGNSGGSGGAILNAGNLTVNQSNIIVNTAVQGGGIYNNGGSLTVNRSTLSGNSASSGGGGIYNYNGTAGVTANVTLTNTTVSGNSVGGGFGGGYFGFSDLGATQLNANNATIASNVAVNGGGIAVTSNATGLTSRATIDNTIVGDNMAINNGPDVFDNSLLPLIVPIGLPIGTSVIPGAITSSGYNIIENTSGASITPQLCNVSAAMCDQFGVDAKLLPLANNSFVFAPSHALNTAAGNLSPAVDQGDSLLTEDQRGMWRPFDIMTIAPAPGGNNADIGAFEVQLGSTAATAVIAGRVMQSSGKGVALTRVTITDLSGVTRTTTTNFFGFYHFAGIPTGGTYVLGVSSKIYSFTPQVITVNEDMSELNFILQP